MLWKEVKSWASKNGYETFREKTDNDDNPYDYYWSKTNDINVTGLAISVSKLAKQIYNHITNDIHKEYQENYETKINSDDIDHAKITSW